MESLKDERDAANDGKIFNVEADRAQLKSSTIMQDLLPRVKLNASPRKNAIARFTNGKQTQNLVGNVRPHILCDDLFTSVAALCFAR